MNKEVQFTDARELAEKYGEVISMDWNDQGDVEVAMVLEGGEEVVALVFYEVDGDLSIVW